jgi:hypothetical protein
MALLPLLPRCASASAACKQKMQHGVRRSYLRAAPQPHTCTLSSNTTSQPHLQQQRGEVAQQWGCRLI